jgi:Ca2+-binding EF-hand superfamily protein
MRSTSDLKIIGLLGVVILVLARHTSGIAAEARSPFARGQKMPEKAGIVLDANGDGVVTDAETQKAAAELQRQARVQSERAKAILDAFDNNDDGAVDPGEAANGAARARIAFDGVGRVVAEIFAKVDVNADGLISQPEFAAVVKKLGPVGELLKPRLVQLFLQIDSDRNGAISVSESQMAADFFAKQAQLKAEVQRAQRNQRIWQMAQQEMARLDTSRNGQISQREARRNRQVLAIFDQVDTDLDKQMSAGEVYRYLERKMADR